MPATQIKRASWAVDTFRRSRIDLELSDDLTLEDVAEDVLLDVSFARLMTLIDVVSWLCAHFTPKPPFTSV